MNINFEKIPSSLFDWVETVPFYELSASEKREVLLYFSEEDYTAMYQTAKRLKSVKKRDHALVDNEKRDAILEHFDSNKQQIRQGKIRTLLVWQAAAVVLMVLSGWLFYRMFDLQKSGHALQVAAKDTVYVVKDVSAQPELIHDTVYLYKASADHTKKNATPAYTNDVNEPKPPYTDDIMPAMELQSVDFSTRGSSMKDDSLLKKFGFVAM